MSKPPAGASRAAALHGTVAATHLRSGARLLHGASHRGLARRLHGRALVSSRRHGKLLFVGLDGDAGALVLHFGTTGFLACYRREAQARAHARLVLDLAGGRHLAYDSQRLLGRIALTDDPDAFVAPRRLEPDVLAVGAAGLPGSWLLRHRRAGARCPRCAGRVAHLRVSGRSTWLCRACQRR